MRRRENRKENLKQNIYIICVLKEIYIYIHGYIFKACLHMFIALRHV